MVRLPDELIDFYYQRLDRLLYRSKDFISIQCLKGINILQKSPYMIRN